MVYGALYYFTNALCVMQGLLPTTPPLLPIPVESYYKWQFLFGIPLTLAVWWLFSVLAWGVGRLLGGTGESKDLVRVSAFSFFLPQIPTIWLVETLLAGIWPRYWGGGDKVPAFWNGLLNVYLFGGAGWVIVASTIAVQEVLRLPWWRAFIATVIGAGAAIALMAMVIR